MSEQKPKQPKAPKISKPEVSLDPVVAGKEHAQKFTKKFRKAVVDKRRTYWLLEEEEEKHANGKKSDLPFPFEKVSAEVDDNLALRYSVCMFKELSGWVYIGYYESLKPDGTPDCKEERLYDNEEYVQEQIKKELMEQGV